MNYEKKHLNIRKTILGVLLFVVTLVTLTGCGQFNVDMKVYEEDDGISIKSEITMDEEPSVNANIQVEE